MLHMCDISLRMVRIQEKLWNIVIRLRLTELMDDVTFKRGQRIELKEVAEATGLHRATLYRMVNVRGYNATLNNIDALCRFFGCGVGDVAVYVPDEEVPQAALGSATDKANA